MGAVDVADFLQPSQRMEFREGKLREGKQCQPSFGVAVTGENTFPIQGRQNPMTADKLTAKITEVVKAARKRGFLDAHSPCKKLRSVHDALLIQSIRNRHSATAAEQVAQVIRVVT